MSFPPFDGGMPAMVAYTAVAASHTALGLVRPFLGSDMTVKISRVRRWP